MSQVITIDKEVRTLLKEFVNLYATFEQAAAAINVNRSTIAVYMQGAHTVPAAQLKEIIRIVKRRMSDEELAEIFDRGWDERMLSGAHQHTFLHQDMSAYRLNEELIRLLEYFASFYPTRARAAEILELGAEEFVSFLDGGENSLPRSLYRKVMEVLKEEHGVGEQAICEALAFSNMDSVLKAADRTANSEELSAVEIIDSLVDLWLDGGGSVRNNLRTVYNYCRQTFGGLAQAYVQLMGKYMAHYEQRGQAAIADGRADEVLGLLDRMLSAVRWYAQQVSDGRNQAQLAAEFAWQDDVRHKMEVHNRLRDLLFKEAPFSHQFMAKSEVQKLLFRYRHLTGVREYLPSTTYSPGDLIFHPMFGVGRVTKREGHHKVWVRFTETESDVLLSVGT